jgi:hypothetical protein
MLWVPIIAVVCAISYYFGYMRGHDEGVRLRELIRENLGKPIQDLINKRIDG